MLTRYGRYAILTGVFRLGVVGTGGTQDGQQQSGKHLPSGSSCGVPDQLYAVADL